MKLSKVHFFAILGMVCLLLSACGGGDGGDDNSTDNSTDNSIIVTDSTIIVESINSDNIDNNFLSDDADNNVASESQSDCRRPDVLRVGRSDPGAPLFLFPDSVPLPLPPPFDTLQRQIQVPDGSPLYFDSIVISEIGTVSVTHVAEGPAHTVMELFEMNIENRINSLVGSGEFDEFNGRAGVNIPLLPGVYCFYISDAAGAFANNTRLTVDYVFTPP